MEWYLKVLRNYANFSGRARRKEYWMFALLNFIFTIIAMIMDNVLGINYGMDIFYGPLYTIYALAVIIPSLAVLVRRLHDVGKSGWWFFISLIPIVGAIWLLVLTVTDSESGENQWGPNPKDVSSNYFHDDTLDGDIMQKS
ncbi:MAG: DUF805 domain-containing protein [Bacteroidales bacterium]|nr:DUF805 domain-containing protein [Bacteroidales bacterium]